MLIPPLFAGLFGFDVNAATTTKWCSFFNQFQYNWETDEWDIVGYIEPTDPEWIAQNHPGDASWTNDTGHMYITDSSGNVRYKCLPNVSWQTERANMETAHADKQFQFGNGFSLYYTPKVTELRIVDPTEWYYCNSRKYPEVTQSLICIDVRVVYQYHYRFHQPSHIDSGDGDDDDDDSNNNLV